MHIKQIEIGWSSNVLGLHIQGGLMERSGRSVNNFSDAFSPTDSDLDNQVFKDPYLYDFLGTDMPRREVEIERKLTEHIQSFLLELGRGVLLWADRYIWKLEAMTFIWISYFII